MIDLKKMPPDSYAEVSQKAPLRWAMIVEQEDGTWAGEHNWWKCKDFLNDVVFYLRTGKEFPMYGFKNKVTKQDSHYTFALKHIPNYFEDNLGYLNNFLVNLGHPDIGFAADIQGHDAECAIFIPAYYFTNTFYISLITSLIRSCVYQPIVNGDDMTMFRTEPTLVDYLDQALEQFLPEMKEKKDALIYRNYQYNGNNVGGTYTIHNAGLQSWIDSKVAA